MSLKTFHVVFITCAVLLALAFATWAGSAYAEAGGVAYLGTAVGSAIVAAGLVLYERAFLRRCRRLGLA